MGSGYSPTGFYKKGNSNASNDSLQKNEYQYQNGKLIGSRVYDPNINGYRSDVTNSDAQNAFDTNADQQIPSLLGKINSAYDPSTADYQRYNDALTTIPTREANQAYSQAENDFNQGAIASGMGSSAGALRQYGNIAQNQANTKADIANNAYLQSFNLPSMRAKPYMDLYSLYSGGQLQNQQNSQQQAQLQGSLASNTTGNYSGNFQAGKNRQAALLQALIGAAGTGAKAAAGAP